MFSKAKRATNKMDVQLAGAGVLLGIYKFISLYREYKADSQKEGTSNETA